MPKHLITTKTLQDIARHSNKVIRLSRYMIETEAPLLIDKMSFLDAHSDPFDVMMALDGDLGTTANMLKSVAQVVESLTDEHLATELKGGEQDFRTLFPNAYDAPTRTLTIFGLQIAADGGFSTRPALEIKQMLFQSAFDSMQEMYSWEGYRKHLTLLKGMSTTHRPGENSPFSASLEFAVASAQIHQWGGFYQKAMAIANNFHDYRKSLSPRDRELVDEKVFSGRTMLYGVVKASTYISRANGVEQLSPKHKNQSDVVHALARMLGDVPCIRAIEIDQDASVDKVHDLVIDIKGMRLDHDNAFELKIRKLGNYRFSGYHIKKNVVQNKTEMIPQMAVSSAELRMIVLDISSPGVMAHEITHFRDREPSEMRTKFIRHFGSKMDLRGLDSEWGNIDVRYYTSDVEVLARLGEIGFLLNRHGYQENESLRAFADRVRAGSPIDPLQEEKREYNIPLVKDIDYYLGVESPVCREVYFKMADWTPTELALLRDYTRDFFYAPDPTIQQRLIARVSAGELDYQTKIHQKLQGNKSSNNPKARKTETEIESEKKKTSLLFSKMDTDKLPEAYLAGVSEGVFKDGAFIQALQTHHMRLGLSPTVSSVNWDTWRQQVEMIAALSAVIDPDARPGDMMLLRDFMVELSISMNVIKPDELPPAIQLHRDSVREMQSAVTYHTGTTWGDDAYSAGERINHWRPKNGRDPEYRTICEALKSHTFLFLERTKACRQPSPRAMSEAVESAQLRWVVDSMLDSAPRVTPSNGMDALYRSVSPQFDLLHMALSSEDAVQAEMDAMVVGGALTISSQRVLMTKTAQAELELAMSLLDRGWIEQFKIQPDTLEQLIVDLHWSVSKKSPTLLKNQEQQLRDVLKMVADSMMAPPKKQIQAMRLPNDSTVNSRMSPVSALVSLARRGSTLMIADLHQPVHQFVVDTARQSPHFASSVQSAVKEFWAERASTPQRQLSSTDLTRVSSPIGRAILRMVEGEPSTGNVGPSKLAVQLAQDSLLDGWVRDGLEGIRTSRCAVAGVGNVELSYGDSAYSVVRESVPAMMHVLKSCAMELVEKMPPSLRWNSRLEQASTRESIGQVAQWWQAISQAAPRATAAVLQSMHAMAGMRDANLPPSLSALQEIAIPAAMYLLSEQSGVQDVRPLVSELSMRRPERSSLLEQDLCVTPAIQVAAEPIACADVPSTHIERVLSAVGVDMNEVEPLKVAQDVPAAEGQPLGARNQMRLF